MALEKLKKSAITWFNPKTLKWESYVEIVSGSSQIIELAAVVRICLKFTLPLNLIID